MCNLTKPSAGVASPMAAKCDHLENRSQSATPVFHRESASRNSSKFAKCFALTLYELTSNEKKFWRAACFYGWRYERLRSSQHHAKRRLHPSASIILQFLIAFSRENGKAAPSSQIARNRDHTKAYNGANRRWK